MPSKYHQIISVEAELELLSMRMDSMQRDWEDMKRSLAKFVRQNDRWRRACNRKLRNVGKKQKRPG